MERRQAAQAHAAEWRLLLQQGHPLPWADVNEAAVVACDTATPRGTKAIVFSRQHTSNKRQTTTIAARGRQGKDTNQHENRQGMQ
jgi:hypothetical protein